MKASEILTRARALADLANSEFITHGDEVDSLNEAYKDLYAEITAADDDYYLSESMIILTAGMKGADNEYLVPLPTDFWKLRYLDYKGTDGRWHRMERFSLNLKNEYVGEPMYRFRDTKLWVLVGDSGGFGGQVKVGYYPSPAILSAPESVLTYAASVALADHTKISSPFYVPSAHTMLYVYDSTGILAESADALVTTTLASGLATAVTNLQYYKGYVYYIRAADIWRAPSSLLATITPVKITTLANILNFTIHHDLITFNDGTNIKTCALDGTGTVTLGALAVDDLCYLQDAAHTHYLVYRTASGAVASGAYTIVASGVNHVVSDPMAQYLYIVDTGNHLRRLTVELTGFTVTEDETIAEDVLFLGNANERASVLLREGQKLQGVGLDPDTNLDYPVNALHESMAYQLAVDHKRKQNQESALLVARLSELRMTLLRQLRRDEYQVERVRNHYSVQAGRGW